MQKINNKIAMLGQIATLEQDKQALEGYLAALVVAEQEYADARAKNQPDLDKIQKINNKIAGLSRCQREIVITHSPMCPRARISNGCAKAWTLSSSETRSSLWAAIRPEVGDGAYTDRDSAETDMKTIQACIASAAGSDSH